MPDIAVRDANRVPSLIGVDSSTFTIPTTVAVNTSTHAMLVEASFAPSGVQDVNITQVGGASVTLGQKVSASSIPVVLSSDQGSLTVVGNVASGASDSGNPVKIAGVYNSTKPTFTNAQRGDLQIGTRGSLAVQIMAADAITNVAVRTPADGDTAGNGLLVDGQTQIFNGSNWDRMRGVVNATNSTGTGITAAGILAQFDDVSPTSITENQFGNIRMSANRNLYNTIRDAAGNERGANVTAASALVVDGSAVIQPVSGSATGSTVPSTAFYVGGLNAAGNLEGRRNAAATLNTTTGIEAAGVTAVFDDVAPTAITENQFGTVRMSANRNLYGTIRDAAGNERGANVNASNQLLTLASVDQTTPGTTNNVSVSASTGAGTSVLVKDDPTFGDGVTTGILSVAGRLYNNTSYDRSRSIINATNSIGTGISAVGVVAQFDDTSPTTITENQFGNVRMSADRSILVTPRSVTPTQTSVASSATTVSLLAANASRKGATVYNDSSAVLYLKLGTTASATSFSVAMVASSYYEVPFGYIGAIDALWASATGNARITEIV